MSGEILQDGADRPNQTGLGGDLRAEKGGTDAARL